MAKYYVCEGSAKEGVTQVTPTGTAENALKVAENSTAQIHFVSTVNPLDKEDETNNDR